jgi:hypothetical protein
MGGNVYAGFVRVPTTDGDGYHSRRDRGDPDFRQD